MRELDAKTIAKAFKQGAKAEGAIARVLLAFTRYGQFHTKDGKRFSVRRSA